MTTISSVIARKRIITSDDNGVFLLLADIGDTETGSWTFQFVPSQDFIGELAIVGRIQGKTAYDDDVPFLQVPYRKTYLNGAVGDLSLATALITGTSIVRIPATALAIALLVACTAGTMTVYSYPRYGSTES